MRNDGREFQTTSLHLAAALLAQIPSSSLLKIASNPSVDGRRLILVRYPKEHHENVQTVVDSYLKRKLSVNLYNYNKTLNQLRDGLKN